MRRGVEGAAEAVLVVVVGSFESGETGDVGVDRGLLQDERVAGGERLDLGEGQGLVADVVDVAVGQVASGHLGDERGLPFEGLPHVGVEAALGDVAQHPDLGVLVPLAEDASIALLDVGRTPRRVEVVHGDGTRLHVGADAHGLGGADEYRHRAVAARGEELRFGHVGLGVLHVADRAGVDASPDQEVAQLVVGVPPGRSRRGHVAEHELERARSHGELTVLVGVAEVAGGVMDRGDPLRCNGELASVGGRALTDEAEVECGTPAVTGDLQHVVLARVDGSVADALGPGCEVGDVADQRVVRFDDDRLGLAAGEGRAPGGRGRRWCGRPRPAGRG